MPSVMLIDFFGQLGKVSGVGHMKIWALLDIKLRENLSLWWIS